MPLPPLLPGLKRLVRRVLEAPGRRLRPTTSGKWILGIAMAVGLAAFNTGNNLLFFGWGLSLSAIVISGLLSESTLRSVALSLGQPGELRVGVRSGFSVHLKSASARMPAFGVEVAVRVAEPRGGGAEALVAAEAYELRLSPGEEREVLVPWTPSRRGAHDVPGLEARTSYPFGFFEKARRFVLSPAPRAVVLPARVDVGALSKALLSRLGDSPSQRPGPGDELFGLRPFRQGDDPRRIAWRRTARTGRAVVRETEAVRSREVLLHLALPSSTSASPEAVERAISACGSLAEDLLSAQHAVGLLAPGVVLDPAPGPRQRSAILTALALLDPSAPMAEVGRAGRVARVAVVAEGAPAPAHADEVLQASRAREAA